MLPFPGICLHCRILLGSPSAMRWKIPKKLQDRWIGGTHHQYWSRWSLYYIGFCSSVVAWFGGALKDSRRLSAPECMCVCLPTCLPVCLFMMMNVKNLYFYQKDWPISYQGRSEQVLSSETSQFYYLKLCIPAKSLLRTSCDVEIKSRAPINSLLDSSLWIVGWVSWIDAMIFNWKNSKQNPIGILVLAFNTVE